MTDWIPERLLRTPGVRHAVLFSTDGVEKVASDLLSSEQVDHAAASGAGLLSLARGLATEFGSGTQTVRSLSIQWDGGWLLATGVADRTALLVITDDTVHLAQVGQEIQQTVQQLGERALATAPRPSPGAA
ncbi:roadblock/LC7 domain-containing protein [Actinomadura kijaniata]|uniref:roadblock/LC7 domain-containing protein n=1 Tax=Actinomadura kijaniata TaxID=46161 RepID=UPI0008336B8D|nr:roadblock/LC7 domain-containing protein [Actinomadura kijaniata]